MDCDRVGFMYVPVVAAARKCWRGVCLNRHIALLLTLAGHLEPGTQGLMRNVLPLRCRASSCTLLQPPQLPQQEYDKALETYQRGLEHEPDNAELKEGIDRCVEAISRFASGNATQEEIKERQAHAMADPEVQNILRDPVMQVGFGAGCGAVGFAVGEVLFGVGGCVES